MKTRTSNKEKRMKFVQASTHFLRDNAMMDRMAKVFVSANTACRKNHYKSYWSTLVTPSMVKANIEKYLGDIHESMLKEKMRNRYEVSSGRLEVRAEWREDCFWDISVNFTLDDR